MKFADFFSVGAVKIMIISRNPGKIRSPLKDAAGFVPEFRNMTTFREAFEVMEWLPDLIITDEIVNMAAANFFRNVKEMPGMAHVMLIVIARGRGYLENAATAYEAGVNDVMMEDFAAVLLPLKMKNLIRVKIIKDQMTETNARLQQQKLELELDKKMLRKYFSADLIEAILKQSISTEAGGGGILNVTVLFFDMRNSTGIAEKLSPDQFSQILNLLFTDIMDIIFGNQGSVNKIMGDGILATFGCPNPQEDDAANAVNAALSIRKYLQTFNLLRPSYLPQPVQAGVGIATGKVFAGNIGSINRMEYTVLGDAVNTANRLQALTKKAGLDILLDRNTRKQAPASVKFKRLNVTRLRGKSESIQVFHPVD